MTDYNENLIVEETEDSIEEQTETTSKYDFEDMFYIYSNLLSKNERKRLAYYIFDDYSLSEIAEIENATRTAVHKSIKQAFHKLDRFEDALHLTEFLASLESLETIEEVKELICSTYYPEDKNQ